MEIDWKSVQRVLVVRLRSIGDTVLATPSLIALKRFLPNARVDILLEDWVAPLLDEFDSVDNVIIAGKTTLERLATIREIRKRKYDVVFNLHGGTTSIFFTFASGATHRVGHSGYRYSFLHNHHLSSASDFWKQEHTHSAEQQLALLGCVGVPVDDRPRSRLAVTNEALESLEKKFNARTQSRKEITGRNVSVNEHAPMQKPARSKGETRKNEHADSAFRIPHLHSAFALLHPTAAFATKQWSTENFAQVAEYLAENGIKSIAVASKNEQDILDKLESISKVQIITFDDLSLPEITALASKARLFVGNDSGIAHIAAAVNTPTVVIFGSSNRHHWYPWTYAPNEMVFEPLPCQPCPGYECKEFGDPKCILSVRPENVFAAIDRVITKTTF
ncbi:MAG: glycosyltransferase family 9 protein [Pyrinomonadaceae bacterium]